LTYWQQQVARKRKKEAGKYWKEVYDSDLTDDNPQQGCKRLHSDVSQELVGYGVGAVEPREKVVEMKKGCKRQGNGIRKK